MRIDFHTHPTLLEEYVLENEDLRRASRDVFDIGNNPQPVEVFHLQMDAAGIDRAVIHPVDCERTQDVSIFTNEQIAEICARHDRFIGLASVDPKRPDAASRLEHAVLELGLRGLILAPELQYVFPDDREVTYDLFQKAEELSVPVLVHCGQSWAKKARMKFARPLALEDVAFDFPDLDLVIAKFGWPWIRETAALAMKLDNVYVDLGCLYYGNPVQFFRQTFTRQLPVTVIENSLRHKILFGSNYPRVEIKNMVKAVDALELSGPCRKALFETNPARILDLEEDDPQ